MSNDSKVWQVLLIAALMVGTTWGVLLIGTQNEPHEPGLPSLEPIVLKYEVTGTYNGTDVNGSFEMQITISDDNGLSYFAEQHNVTGNIGDLAYYSFSILGFGSYLDEAFLGTAWGEKAVHRYLEYAIVLPSLLDSVCVCHRGAHTGLAYRVDALAPDLKVTYELVDISITGMEELDLNHHGDADGFPRTRHADLEFVDDNFVGDCDGGPICLVEPNMGEDIQFNFTATNLTCLVCDEEDIWNMVNGGDFQYNADWSVIGNGSVGFLIEDQMVYCMVFPTEEGPGTTAHLVIGPVDE